MRTILNPLPSSHLSVQLFPICQPKIIDLQQYGHRQYPIRKHCLCHIKNVLKKVCLVSVLSRVLSSETKRLSARCSSGWERDFSQTSSPPGIPCSSIVTPPPTAASITKILLPASLPDHFTKAAAIPGFQSGAQNNNCVPLNILTWSSLEVMGARAKPSQYFHVTLAIHGVVTDSLLVYDQQCKSIKGRVTVSCVVH